MRLLTILIAAGLVLAACNPNPTPPQPPLAADPNGDGNSGGGSNGGSGGGSGGGMGGGSSGGY